MVDELSPRLAKINAKEGIRIASAYIPLPSGPSIRASNIDITIPIARFMIREMSVMDVPRKKL